MTGIERQGGRGREIEAEAETGAMPSIGLGAEAGSAGEMIETGAGLDMTGAVIRT